MGEGVMTKDPVCGMAVTRDTMAGSSEYQGKAYYFCSPACKESFDRDPQRYHLERLTETR
jgi:YHS domain-containing protein